MNCQEQQQQQQGIVLCNVRLLHKILMNECNTLPAAMSGQRSLILEVPLLRRLLCPRPLGGGIKRWCTSVCLSDVCLSRTSGLSREQRGLGRLKLAQR